MFPRLISVEAPAKYKLRVRFSDGLEGTLDVSSLAGKGVFKAWDENDLFFHPYLDEASAIAWSDHIDIDANNIYLKLKNITFAEWRQASLSNAAD